MIANPSIQTLRAIAIFLVIGIHITKDGPIAGAYAFYDWLDYTLLHVRMPIFTVISGYLYAYKTVCVQNFTAFAQGKARRLLIPFAVVASAEYFAKAVQNGAGWADVARWPNEVFILTYEHYWFIQSIFLVILFTGVLDIFHRLASPKKWALCIAATLPFYFLMRGVNFDYFGISGASYLLPYFLFGVGLNRFPHILSHKKAVASLFLALAACITLQQLSLAGMLDIDTNPRTALGLFLGLGSCYLLFWLKPSFAPLAKLGHYSFAIYLFQGFTTPLGRYIAKCLQLEGHGYFVAVLSITAALGILAERIFSLSKPFRLAFLGVK